MLLKTFIKQFMVKASVQGEKGLVLKKGIDFFYVYIEDNKGYDFVMQRDIAAISHKGGLGYATNLPKFEEINILGKTLHVETKTGKIARLSVKLKDIKELRIDFKYDGKRYIVQDKMSAYRK